MLNSSQELNQMVDQAIKQYVGRKVDIDGKFGTQCVDLAQTFWRNCLRHLVSSPDAWLLTGNGTAVGYWLVFRGAWTKYFTKIPRTKGKPFKPGDLVIWSQGISPTGHVAIFVKYDSAGKMVVLEQDGSIDVDAQGRAQGRARIKTWPNQNHVIGSLRLNLDSGPLRLNLDSGPLPAPTPAQKKSPIRSGIHELAQPYQVITNKAPTNFWKMSSFVADWQDATHVSQVIKGETLTIVAEYSHVIGAIYLMTQESLSSLSGINQVDGDRVEVDHNDELADSLEEIEGNFTPSKRQQSAKVSVEALAYASQTISMAVADSKSKGGFLHDLIDEVKRLTKAIGTIIFTKKER